MADITITDRHFVEYQSDVYVIEWRLALKYNIAFVSKSDLSFNVHLVSPYVFKTSSWKIQEKEQ
jgi:hypothetical protein